jgi:hypothetical protein
MIGFQSDRDLDHLLSGDNSELLSPFNGSVKKIKFTIHIMKLIEEIKLFKLLDI